MNTVAIIQARMNSSRLPGKVMLPLADTCVLDVVRRRLAAARRVDRVVVATSLSRADTAIERWAAQNRVDCFKGSEADVLDRVYQAALSWRADVVVDITADCPLVDPRHIDRLVAMLADGDAQSMSPRDSNDYCGTPDYVSNCFVRDWPDGLDMQVYTIDVLERAHRLPTAIREHVGWNIPHRLAAAEPDSVHVRQPMAPAKYRHPDWGLTLDEPADYALLKKLFVEMTLRYGDVLFPVEAALDWLLEHPEALAMNAGVRRHANSNTAAEQKWEDSK